MPAPKGSTLPSGNGVRTSHSSLPYTWPRYDCTITNIAERGHGAGQ